VGRRPRYRWFDKQSARLSATMGNHPPNQPLSQVRGFGIDAKGGDITDRPPPLRQAYLKGKSPLMLSLHDTHVGLPYSASYSTLHPHVPPAMSAITKHIAVTHFSGGFR
jgi:hypothetical protein